MLESTRFNQLVPVLRVVVPGHGVHVALPVVVEAGVLWVLVAHLRLHPIPMWWVKQQVGVVVMVGGCD